MRGFLRKAGKVVCVVGVLLVLAVTGFWVARGAHTGWTKTYVEIQRVDDVTGIPYSEKADRFVPGVDFLIPGAGAGFLCIFAGMAILVFSRTKQS
jgi:hypothetical protein